MPNTPRRGVDMHARIRQLVLALCGLACAPVLAAAPGHAARATFDAAFDAAMARYHLPGLAVGVIEDGEVVYVRTAGELVAGSGQPVTPDTLFKIASNSKAMTASVLARLVDAGKLRWDDPVIRHLPQFRMHDAWVTREMQVRDLLIHNSGLRPGRGRPDAVAGAEPLHPQRHHRRARAHQAGLQLPLRLRLRQPAVRRRRRSRRRRGRRLVRGTGAPRNLRSRSGCSAAASAHSIAMPSATSPNRTASATAVPWSPTPTLDMVPAITSAAAGGIRCSLGDMLTWARNWLLPDTRQPAWLSPAQRSAMWTAAHADADLGAAPRLGQHPLLRLRLRLAPGRCRRRVTVSHTGTLSGMYSVMTLLPDQRSRFRGADEWRRRRSAHRAEPGAGGAFHRAGAGATASTVMPRASPPSRSPPAARHCRIRLQRVPATPAELASRLGI